MRAHASATSTPDHSSKPTRGRPPRPSSRDGLSPSLPADRFVRTPTVDDHTRQQAFLVQAFDDLASLVSAGANHNLRAAASEATAGRWGSAAGELATAGCAITTSAYTWGSAGLFGMRWGGSRPAAAAQPAPSSTPPSPAAPRYVPTNASGEPLPLPRGPYGEEVPLSPRPHTEIGWRIGRRGGYVQTREFGDDGRPVKLVDWTDHGRPAEHPNPHVHDYLDNPSGGTPRHGPARPLRPGECAP